MAYGSGTGTIYDVHTDHLDTPRMLTDSTGAAVWRADASAFGQATVDEDPDGDATPVTFNLRFPGQYYDKETERWDPDLNGGAGGYVEGTGLHYNRFRYYDPGIGRYVSADPIGQAVILVSLAEASAGAQSNLPAFVRSMLVMAATDTNLYSYTGNNPLMRSDPLGLSYLVFDRGAGTITLYTSNGSQVGTWPANNNVTSSANGAWPAGTYSFAYYVPHPSSGPNGAYGSNGNFVFNVPGRTGMGVHSGRANLAGPDQPTLGCVRTTNAGTSAIYNTHFGGANPQAQMSVAPDPLTHITITGGSPQSSLPNR